MYVSSSDIAHKPDTHTCHMRRRIHVCHMRRRIHTCQLGGGYMYVSSSDIAHKPNTHTCHMRRRKYRLGQTKQFSPLKNCFVCPSLRSECMSAAVENLLPSALPRLSLSQKPSTEEEDTCMPYEEEDTAAPEPLSCAPRAPARSCSSKYTT
jgi:hypothetical protein